MTMNSLNYQHRTCKESPVTIAVGPQSSDIQIVHRFQRGDSTAFDFLYLRYRSKKWIATAIEIPHRIYGVICSMISNREDALDITQDIFLKAHQALGKFKRTSQFYSWFSRIAINCCIDYMRRQSKHRMHSNDPASDDVFYRHEVTRHLSSPSKAVELEEFGTLLHQAVLQLTPKQREVFTLRYKEDLSLKEIACKMERSIGTVKAHLFQIHRKLREMLLPYFRYGQIETWGSN